MATKTSSLTLITLNAKIAKLQAQAEKLRAKEVAGVIARVRVAIDHYGLTAADLGFGVTSARTKLTSGGAASPKSPRKPADAKPARAIKYADGQGKTWSGIGKRPNWFKEAIAAGKQPEELLAKADS
jgi:DNA-binding protein H-NS